MSATTDRPSFQPETLARRDASGQIAQQLRDAILDGTWQPGDKLPSETELANTFDVARGTAREALTHLGATGIITTARGASGGTFVVAPEAGLVAAQLRDAIMLWFRSGDVSITEVDEARRILELQVVALAARRRDNSDVVVLEAALRQAVDPKLSMADWLATDLAFHTAITRAAHNPILELAMTSIHLVRPHTNEIFVAHLDRNTIQSQHAAIAAAIADADPELAQRRLLEHVDHLDAVRRTALAERAAADIPIADLLPETQ